MIINTDKLEKRLSVSFKENLPFKVIASVEVNSDGINLSMWMEGQTPPLAEAYELWGEMAKEVK